MEMRRQFNAALRHHRQHPMQGGAGSLSWIWQKLKAAAFKQAETPAIKAAFKPAETPAMKALETLRRKGFHLNLNDDITAQWVILPQADEGKYEAQHLKQYLHGENFIKLKGYLDRNGIDVSDGKYLMISVGSSSSQAFDTTWGRERVTEVEKYPIRGNGGEVGAKKINDYGAVRDLSAAISAWLQKHSDGKVFLFNAIGYSEYTGTLDKLEGNVDHENEGTPKATLLRLRDALDPALRKRVIAKKRRGDGVVSIDVSWAAVPQPGIDYTVDVGGGSYTVYDFTEDPNNPKKLQPKGSMKFSMNDALESTPVPVDPIDTLQERLGQFMQDNGLSPTSTNIKVGFTGNFRQEVIASGATGYPNVWM